MKTQPSFGLVSGSLASAVVVVLVTLLASTTADAQKYRFPIQLPAPTQPYITAHRDNNSGAGIDDYACGNDAYNGHGGTDIGIGGFPAMDAGRTAVAAADGVVKGVRDGCYDRCTSGGCACADGFGNYVRIDHANGLRTYYGHLKKGSVAVSLNQTVTCGTPVGKVGSSGNSTGPHLHFEVRNSSNVNDDPYSGSCGGPTSYWVAQGSYGGLPGATCAGGAAPPPPPPAVTTGTISGVVFEDTGAGTDDMTQRLSGASLRVVGEGMTTTAEGDGANWTFTIAPGTYTVRASAPGYDNNERSCAVTAGATTWCSIGLTETPPPVVEEPPVEEPPVEEPPVEEPPVEEPPAEEPPADDPPAEDPPVDEPPAEDPPTGEGDDIIEADGDPTGDDDDDGDAVEPVALHPSSVEEGGGCSQTSVDGALLSWLLMLGVVLVRRRCTCEPRRTA